jgi:hypothetical protein
MPLTPCARGAQWPHPEATIHYQLRRHSTAYPAQPNAEIYSIADTMKSFDRSADPFSTRAPRPVASESYLGSSLDLQAGLRVRELMVSACPPDVIRELVRMRKAWGSPAGPAAV